MYTKVKTNRASGKTFPLGTCLRNHLSTGSRSIQSEGHDNDLLGTRKKNPREILYRLEILQSCNTFLSVTTIFRSDCNTLYHHFNNNTGPVYYERMYTITLQGRRARRAARMNQPSPAFGSNSIQISEAHQSCGNERPS